MVNSRLNVLRSSGEFCDTQEYIEPVVAKNFLCIPYIKGLSDNVCRNLKKFNIDVVFSVPKKLNCVIKRAKDKLVDLKQTEIVYKLNCMQCDASYIGQTKRHLQTRINEHRKDINKHISNLSVVSKHRTSFAHDFNWSEPEILHKEMNTRKREIAEMFFIKRQQNTINLQSDTDNLTAVYDKVIDAT